MSWCPPSETDRASATVAASAAHRPRAALVAAALVLALAPVVVACGTSCEEIAARRDAYLGRTAHTDAPHASLTVPLGLANRLVAERLERRTSDRLDVDVLAQAGLHLGVVFTLDGVRFVPAPDGRVGVEVDVAVRDGREPLFTVELAAEVRPEVDPVARVARVMLRPDRLRRISPRLDPEGRARVAAWLRRALPEVLTAAFDDDALGRLADAAVAWLFDSGFPLVRDNLLDGLDETPLLAVALPDLPIVAATFATREGREPALGVDIVTSLPVAHGLGPDHASARAGAVELRLAGETAAELANAAIARGDIPSRYDRDGEPSPDGPFEARLGWGRTPRPLKVHLWCTRGDCTYVRVGGTPVVTITEDDVNVAVSDGVFEIIKGSALSEAFAWTKTLFADPVRLGVKVARRVRLDAPGGGVELGVTRVEVGAADLRVVLAVRNLGPETAPAGPPRLGQAR